jgi:hypothetical protein
MTNPEHSVLFACRLLLRTQRIQGRPGGHRKIKELLAATDGEFWWPLVRAGISQRAMNRFLNGGPIDPGGPIFIISWAARFKLVTLGTKDKARVSNAIKKFCATLTD